MGSAPVWLLLSGAATGSRAATCTCPPSFDQLNLKCKPLTLAAAEEGALQIWCYSELPRK